MPRPEDPFALPANHSPLVTVDSRNGQLFDNFEIDLGTITGRLQSRDVDSEALNDCTIAVTHDEEVYDSGLLLSQYRTNQITLCASTLVQAGMSRYTADVLQAEQGRGRKKQPKQTLNQHIEGEFNRATNHMLEHLVDSLKPPDMDEIRSKAEDYSQEAHHLLKQYRLYKVGLLGLTAAATTGGTVIGNIFTGIALGYCTVYGGRRLMDYEFNRALGSLYDRANLLLNGEARAERAEVTASGGLFRIAVSSEIEKKAQENINWERQLLD